VAALLLLLLSPGGAFLGPGLAGADAIVPEPAAVTKLPRTELPHTSWAAAAPDTGQTERSENVSASGGTWYVAPSRRGYMLSVPYTVHTAKRWDYAATFAVPGPSQGTVTLTVLDPDGTPEGGFPGEVVAQVVVLAGEVAHADLRAVDTDAHARLQLHIGLNNTQGGSQLGVTGWRIGDCDVDLWHDAFYGIGREQSIGNLSLGGGSVVATDLFLPGGIKGEYYDNRDFTAYRYTTLDPTIDFDWGNGGPNGLGANTFSIRWTGKVYIQRAGQYTFFLRIDDGGRLWVDGAQLIDQWKDQGATEYPAVVTLSMGLHDLRIDYYENQGGALCEFRWQGPGITKRIVPQAAMWGRDAINELVSERIICPSGSTWDLMLLRRGSGDGYIDVDVLDAATGQPIVGLVGLLTDAIDLGQVNAASTPTIQLRATWQTTDPSRSPSLIDWAVNWKPVRTWRSEFLTDIGIRGHVGLVRDEGYIQKPYSPEDSPQMVFAEGFDGHSTTVSSSVYTGGIRDGGVMTTNASDVAMGDLDGDGVLDVLFTSSTPGANASAYRGYGGGFEDEPMEVFAHSPGSGAGATFAAVCVADLIGSHPTILLPELTDSGKGRLLLYWWNGSGGGYNATPDQVVGDLSGRIEGVATGKIDGDAIGDIVISVKDGSDQGVHVLWGGSGGYSMAESTKVLSLAPAIGMTVARLNADGYDDILVGGTYGDPPTMDHMDPAIMGVRNREDIVPLSFPDGGSPADAISVIDWWGNGAIVVASVGLGNLSLINWPGGPAIDEFDLLGATDLAPIDYGMDGNEDLVVSVAESADVPQLRDYGSIGSWIIARMGPVTYQAQLATDGAVAVAAGRMFGPATGALRTGKIDVGDPRFIGGWDTVKFRLASEQPEPGQTVTLRILDGETEKLLWNRTSSEASGAFNISSIKVKEHPTIYLEAWLKNINDARQLQLGAISVNWTERRAAPPRVITLAADDSVIYRTNGTRLRVSVDDEFDLPEDLTVILQVRPPGAQGWAGVGLGQVQWDGAGFSVTFDTTPSFGTGGYDFRARATDTDMMDSDWLERDGLVRVVNNPPGTPGIRLEPSRPITSDDIRCIVERQAYDRDTPHLDYLYSWSRDGVPMPQFANATVPANATRKGDNWTVTVRAFDGEDTGPPVSASVVVGNSPPVLAKPFTLVMMNEDSPPVAYDLAAHFGDPDGDALTITITGLANVTLSYDPVKGIATISTPPDWWGEEVARVNVSDGTASTSAQLEVVVRSIYDAPVFVTIGGRAPEGGAFHLDGVQDRPATYLVVLFDPDSSRFTFRSDAGLSWLTVGGGNGTLTVRPTNDAVGTWLFNLSVQDDSGESVVARIELVIGNVNDPPGIVYINNPKNGKVFQANDSILLQGACSDPDERLGQALNFTWSSNVTGVLGHGPSLTLRSLKPGDHVITLEVSDGQYIKRSSVRIRVLNPLKPPGGGGGGGGDEPYVGPRAAESTVAIVLGLILLALVMALAILIVTRQRAKQQAMRPRGVAAPVMTTAGMPVEPSAKRATGITVEQPRDMRSIMTEPSAKPPVEAPRPAGPAGWEIKKPPPPGAEPKGDWEEY
jgi:hypothetical protein